MVVVGWILVLTPLGIFALSFQMALRAGLERFTKILFGVHYFDGRPDPGTRLDPNDPQLSSGSEHWPFVKQPFRSWPNALALTPAGNKLYVTLPGREGYPDWRVAVVDTIA